MSLDILAAELIEAFEDGDMTAADASARFKKMSPDQLEELLFSVIRVANLIEENVADMIAAELSKPVLH